MKLIYLASPYSSKYPWIRWWRWRQICRIQAYLTISNPDCCFYGPIAMNHPLAVRYKLPTDFNYWRNTCITIIDKCDELWVAQIKGWDLSSGVKEEVRQAILLNKYVRYLNFD